MNQFIRDYKFTPFLTQELDNFFEYDSQIQQSTLAHFKILHQNIRSLSKNIDQIKVYLNQIRSQFECLVLTETWKLEDINFFKLDGYDILYNEGCINKNDGVVIYLKNTINYSAQVVQIGEIRALQISFNIGNKSAIITALYRPPSINANLFLEHLREYFTNITETSVDYHIFLGDMNINIKVENDLSFEYLNILSEYNFISLINETTRINETGGTGTCIDHIFLKTKNTLNDNYRSFIIKTCITDHYTTVLNILEHTQEKNYEINEKHIKYINYKKLKELLRDYNWAQFYELKDVNLAAEKFVDIVKENMQQSTIIQRIKKKETKRSSWITNGLVRSINKRDELYKKYKRKPDNTVAKNQFLTYRNQLTNLLRITKIEYYKNKIKENDKDPKKLWDTVKEIGNEKQKDTIIKEIKNELSKTVHNKKEIANTFNNYYSKVGKNLANQIVAPLTPYPSSNTIKTTFFLTPTDKKEIVDTIKTLKKNKTPGIDMIRAETLKEISNEIAEPLTYLINKSFSDSICPSVFKKAIIKPIYKSGNKLETSNYRPISLIINFAKIFEKIIKTRIVNYLKKYNLLSKNQYGFTEGKSTEDAICALTSHIYKALDESKPSICIFLDLAKAFDTVNHRQLLDSLQELGFRGQTLNLFRSYLTDRSQYVLIGEEMSDAKTVEYGVPQGTVLGPILFNIYLNNIFTLRTTGEIISFADDTAVFYKSDSWHSLKQEVENDMSTIINWFNHKQLTINTTKTKFMPFSSYKSGLPTYNELNITDTVKITTCFEIKYLGIYIDSHLRWDFHVNKIIKILRTLIYKFKFISQVLELPQLKIIYFALIESRISYGILGWGGLNKTQQKRLEIIQKYFMKIIMNKTKTYSTEAIFEQLKVLDIRQIYFLKVILYQHKNINTMEYIEHQYNTRNKSNKLAKIPVCGKTIGQRGYVFLAPRLYNLLPLKIKAIKSLKVFKNKAKRFIHSSGREKIDGFIDLKNT